MHPFKLLLPMLATNLLTGNSNAKCVATKLSNSTGTTLRALNSKVKIKSEFPKLSEALR